MQTFSSLNTIETVEFQDQRTPGIKTDVPRAFDAEFTETVPEFNLVRPIDIVEIIRPDLANVRYQIDVTTQVQGAIPTVDFGTLPAGLTLVESNNIYILSGIQTLEQWAVVRNPLIQINDFLGNFAYTAKIIFNDGVQDQQISWQVGTYVPAALLAAEFTLSGELNDVLNLKANLSSNFVLRTEQFSIKAAFSMSTIGTKVNGLNSVLNSQTSLSVTGRIVELLNLTYTIDNPESLPNTHSFGTVAVNNNFALIGAPGYDQSGSTNIGRAYLYSLTNGSLQQSFAPTFTFESNLNFGTSVALSNSYAMVGNKGTLNNTARARIYNLTNGNLLHTLDTNQNQAEVTVSLTDSYAIVALPNKNGGQVYVYDLNNNANLLHTLTSPNGSVFDFFGQALSVYENRLLVGSAFYQADAYRGRAYVYDLPTGNLLTTLSNPSPVAPNINDGFADSVSLFGNFAVVGAQFEDTALAGPFNTGKVYVFNATTGSLIRTINPPNLFTESNSNFGRQVSADDNFVIISGTGNKYVYVLSSGTLIKTLSETGNRVDISQNHAIIGAPETNNGSGTVFIYKTVIIG